MLRIGFKDQIYDVYRYHPPVGLWAAQCADVLRRRGDVGWRVEFPCQVFNWSVNVLGGSEEFSSRKKMLK